MQVKRRSISHEVEPPGPLSETGSSIDVGVLPTPTVEHLLGTDISRLTRDIDRPIDLLEAGCGRSWTIDLSGRPTRITGADVDRLALEHRIQVVKDMDSAVVGDLRDPELMGTGQYDVVYCAFVLEHVPGAEQVMDNFVSWLRPDGVLVIRIPDGDTVFGSLGKLLPHRLHIIYERWILGKRNAGRPGHGPYETVYDPIISLSGLRHYCEARRLSIDRVYKTNFCAEDWNAKPLKWRLIRLAMAARGFLSFRRLDASYSDIAVIIRKSAQ